MLRFIYNEYIKKGGDSMKQKITLAAARVNAKLTQQMAAEALGISRATMMKYEKGDWAPDIHMAQAMSALYKMPLDCLLFAKNAC